MIIINNTKEGAVKNLQRNMQIYSRKQLARWSSQDTCKRSSVYCFTCVLKEAFPGLCFYFLLW